MTDDIAHTELIAVLVAVTGEQPRVMTVRPGQTQVQALPSGPFETGHRSLQSGLRAWVQAETAHPVGYLEQLYTFADRDRHPEGSASFRSAILAWYAKAMPRRAGGLARLVRISAMGGPSSGRASHHGASA